MPRPIRFHDLRHTTATLLSKADVSLATVQRILRHTDPAITSEIYGHLDLDDMRKAVNKLSFNRGPVLQSHAFQCAGTCPSHSMPESFMGTPGSGPW